MNKVSLILTTYNSLQNLKDTLASISEQEYPSLEIIVVDGLSSDGTVDYIQSFSAFPIKWISEMDSGIYDAMNKGYRMCSGDIIAFFNDQFTDPLAVSLLMSELNKHPECIGVHSDLIYMQGNKVKRSWKMGEGEIRKGWLPAHPTLFLKKEVFEQYGIFNTSYTCSADYEFMVRILCDTKNKLAYVPKTLIRMYYGGTSTGGLKNYMTSIKESYRALVENKVNHPRLIILLRIVKVVRQFFPCS